MCLVKQFAKKSLLILVLMNSVQIRLDLMPLAVNFGRKSLVRKPAISLSSPFKLIKAEISVFSFRISSLFPLKLILEKFACFAVCPPIRDEGTDHIIPD